MRLGRLRVAKIDMRSIHRGASADTVVPPKAVACRPHTARNYDDRVFLLNNHFCNSRFDILRSTASGCVPELSIALKRELT